MPTVDKYLLHGTTFTLLSTELNGLASSPTAGVVSTQGGTSGLFNNTVGGGGMDGYPMGRYELALVNAPAGTLNNNSVANIWFLSTVDGTTYEDGSVTPFPVPARPPDVVIKMRAVSTAQRPHEIAPLPPGNWYVYLQHANGQSWNATLNTLKVTPFTEEMV